MFESKETFDPHRNVPRPVDLSFDAKKEWEDFVRGLPSVEGVSGSTPEKEEKKVAPKPEMHVHSGPVQSHPALINGRVENATVEFSGNPDHPTVHITGQWVKTAPLQSEIPSFFSSWIKPAIAATIASIVVFLVFTAIR